MIGLLQRVRHARVEVQQHIIAEIGIGLLVFIAVEKDDDESKADRLLERLLGYRVFSDELVFLASIIFWLWGVHCPLNSSQSGSNMASSSIGRLKMTTRPITLAADTRKGMRPGFSHAANPIIGRQLFEYLLAKAHSLHTNVASGQFGADMQVSLTNDGPVTFSLKV